MESDHAPDSLVLSHFLRRTGIHFGGKYSRGNARKAGDFRRATIDGPETGDLHSRVLTDAFRRNQHAFPRIDQGGHLVNKNELVDAVAGMTELTKADAAKAVDAVFDASPAR